MNTRFYSGTWTSESILIRERVYNIYDITVNDRTRTLTVCCPDSSPSPEAIFYSNNNDVSYNINKINSYPSLQVIILITSHLFLSHFNMNIL